MAEANFGFSQPGLASILGQNQLIVPPNQRDFSWTEKEVKTLFQDFARSIADDDSSYFVGTIVTIPRNNGKLEVVDGQQRLATTAIMLAEIRNYLTDRDPMIAQSVDSEILNVIDRSTRARVPRLRLNLDDNEYFRARLTNVHPIPSPSKPSHELIDRAFREARGQVKRIVSGFDEKDHGDTLNRWINFMQQRARAVLLQVPTDADAYRMFETLNDRGLRTSQSDLVKNYLFGRSGDRIDEVQQRWSLMRGALETIEDEDITIRFLRHSLTLIQGFVREHEVYEAVQRLAKATQPVITFSNQLESLANSYVAIYNADHEKWNRTDAARKAVEVLNLFDIKPLRPLMLAITECFTEKETELATRFCVSFGVRLMIAGSTRTGSVEEGIAEAAHQIFTNALTTASALKRKLVHLTPSDGTFSAALETATVSNRKLARYYLRSMELTAKGEREPWHIPNDDRSEINLEHVLPEKPEGHWPQFSDDEVRLYRKRIGNLCLMRASDKLYREEWRASRTKVAIYADSPYELTKQIGTVSDWTVVEITDRQRTLAGIAVRTWTI